MLAHEEVRSWYGWAELSPADPIVAGSLGRWRVIYHVGRYGIAAGGSLKLLFRTASDWPTLQGKDPYEESFLTVSTSGWARLAWRYDARGHAQPWPRAVIVDVAQWGLAEGDTVTFDLGDPEGGSPGVRAQTFAERNHEFRIAVDPFATGQHRAVPSPAVDIVGGPAARLVLVAPSRVAPGEPFGITVRLEDRWGNLAHGYGGEVSLQGLDEPVSLRLAAGDRGLKRADGLRLTTTGVHRLRGREEALGLEGESNPIDVAAGGRLPLWGDLHGQSAETCGTHAVSDYFRYARDVAGLDYCAHQGNAYQVTSAFWREVQEAVQAFDEPGRFAAFLGYKWAGNTGGGGARHVLFPAGRAALYRCSRAQVTDEQAPDCYPLSALYDRLQSEGGLLFVGAGSPRANLDYHNPQLEPLLEVYSAWGEAPWLLGEALQRGYKVGFVANGADQQGRPGACYPGAGDMVSRGGLTCAYAAERTREAIWEALRARRCYATTGARILLHVEADGHAMGEVYRAAGPPQIRVRVSGTAEIERVEIHRGAEVVYRYPEEDGGQPGRVRVVWGGAMAQDWPRHVPWDGTLRCQGARIRAALPYGFHSAGRGIVLQTEDAVSWRSTTAGNENGLLLDLAAEAGACLEFYAPLATLTVPLAGLPYERQLGGEGLHVRVEPLPRGTGQKDLELAWKEEALQPGDTPYYVTVHQVDGAKAWSSPLYVCNPGQFSESVV